MKRIAYVLPVVAMTALGGCMMVGGPTESRDYPNNGFDSIRASSGINVVLSQGPFAVKAEAPEGNLDKILVEQTGNELRVSRKMEFTWFGGNGHYVVNVTAPGITAVDVSGGADLETARLEAARLSLTASGGGDIEARGLKVTMLAASASGGGDIDAEGTCGTATVDTSGGGDFNGKRLDCATVTASADSGGDIEIGASVSATGKASGGGDVRFVGSPATLNKDESSGGDVSVEAR